jgi:predicted nucleic acid-binding protein
VIFIDTSGLYAVMDCRDDNHNAASATWRLFVENATPLATTNYIAVETLALVQSRLGFDAMRELAVSVFPIIEHIIVDAGMHHAAIETLLAQKRRRLSFVDCVSFACMRRFHITEAFSFDKHFTEAGFTLL